MPNLMKFEFRVLSLSSKNYLCWILDVKSHLDAMDLGDIIKEGNNELMQNHMNVMIFPLSLLS